MNNLKITLPATATDTDVQSLMDKARSLASQSKSPATVRAYRSAWRQFENWCHDKGTHPLPATPELVAVYVADRGDHLSVATLEKHLAAISQIHKMGGHNSPCQAEAVRLVMAGLRRSKGTAPSKKSPLSVDNIRQMVTSLPDSLVGIRDRAILLLGFVGGFRRSEIAALNIDDLAFVPEGILVRLVRGKTDQEGRGRQVAIPVGSQLESCPVRAVRTWLNESGIDTGPLFVRLDPATVGTGERLSPYSVAQVVKRAAGRAGLDPAAVGGHSLRRGFATAAARAGASERAIARQTGHQSLKVLRGYIEEGTIWEDCAATKLGL